MRDHQCPQDPFIDLFHQMIDDDDGEGPYEAGCWDLPCLPHVEFHWDQWMVCNIVCLHGTVSGVACGINFMESFTKAVEQFNAFDHSTEEDHKRDDEEWGDYFDRCNRRPYGQVTP
jgi:hypothetical protein